MAGTDEIKGWLAGRIPQDWYSGTPEVRMDRVHRFLAENDRGLLIIEAQPGKGKTALVAHLVEEVFGHHPPRPVHFFYRRTV